MNRNGLVVLIALLTAAFVIGARAADRSKELTDQPASLSGPQLYSSYCAICHGADGKGGGPFAPQLKVWPPDLTQLAKKNSGSFPSMHVAEVIDGEFQRPAHGSRDMPIWGPIFRTLAHGHEDSAQRRINRLVNYLESIQQK